MKNERVYFEVMGQRLPLFASIREVGKLGILPEYSLRLMEAQGKLPGVYTGKMKHVNVRLLLKQPDEESAKAAAAQVV